MTVRLGRDKRRQEAGEFDISRSRVVLICGKRGSGKSYTLGVLIEELKSQEDPPIILMVDPIGIYWTMSQSNREEKDRLNQWRLSPTSLPIKLLVPGSPEKIYETRMKDQMESLGVVFQSLRLNPFDISPNGWCSLFDLSINEPLGICLYRAIQNLHREKEGFNIQDVIIKIQEDPRAQDKTKEALLNRIEMAEQWDIFNNDYQRYWDPIDPDYINILDLSVLDPDYQGLGNLILGVLCKDIFKKRMSKRRAEGLGLTKENLPKIWLMCDEAHRFIPTGRTTLSKEILISWVKEGRQPGLSTVLVTQQPSALDNEVISQCDLILAHKMTNNEDISALNRLSQDYIGSEIKNYLRSVKNIGEALMIDDKMEKVSIVSIRPRRTRHGGGE